jgi:transposase
MFIRRNKKKVGEKLYETLLLVEGFRAGKKVRHKTIANLSNVPKNVITAIENALEGKSATTISKLPQRSGRNFGGLYALFEIAKSLGISEVLGNDRTARLAMLMVSGRILTQGSRRHLTFWKNGYAIKEVLQIDNFTTDDLYHALDWIEEKQSDFEKELFERNSGSKTDKVFMYDITSSYLEGMNNELAEYGYNRDGKKSKKQIVIGLVTDSDGFPISIEVFQGNTSDQNTVPDQIAKLVDKFDQREVVFIGDRGMIKQKGIDALDDKMEDGRYVTAITKPQIEKMLTDGVIAMEQFQEQPIEIKFADVRYVLRRNPVRAKEIAENRQSKLQKIFDVTKKLNKDLDDSPRKNPETALRKIQALILKLKLKQILHLAMAGQNVSVKINESALAAAAKLDGCYVIKTNLNETDVDTRKAHDSYKNLKLVEWAFRTMKTTFLELRPIFHRKANRTRAIVFVAMLAYMIVFEFWKRTRDLGVPLEEMIAALDQIQTIEFQITDHWITSLPTHRREDQQKYLDALGIKFPTAI